MRPGSILSPECLMDSQTALFQQHRQRLFGLAYRMLGTPADAEDVLHDAWLRWHAQNVAALDDPEAWLVTVTTRIALDRLRRAKTERAHYRSEEPRLNSSHMSISYAVFCLKKKK